MRTVPLDGCGSFKTGDDPNLRPANRTGIIRYVEGDTRLPTTTASFAEDPECRDQAYHTLKPVHPWKVGDPVNYGTSLPSPSGRLRRGLHRCRRRLLGGKTC